jgi:hypothetical protein
MKEIEQQDLRWQAEGRQKKRENRKFKEGFHDSRLEEASEEGSPGKDSEMEPAWNLEDPEEGSEEDSQESPPQSKIKSVEKAFY